MEPVIFCKDFHARNIGTQKICLTGLEHAISRLAVPYPRLLSFLLLLEITRISERSKYPD